MAVNTLTGYLLLTIEKPTEALEFISIAERIAYQLIDKNIASKEEENKNSQGHVQDLPLDTIGESGNELGEQTAKGNPDNFDCFKSAHVASP